MYNLYSDEQLKDITFQFNICHSITKTNKTETQHVELINSQNDHKRRTSFIYVVLKVVQAIRIVLIVLIHVTVLFIIYQLFGINIEIMYKISSSMSPRGNF